MRKKPVRPGGGCRARSNGALEGAPADAAVAKLRRADADIDGSDVTTMKERMSRCR